mmetsp:Transcript_44450/g.123335  ORF Transcript_44450/g.123335 Transcript_44450/m.123335 type:complete len:312 (-) Transcript_44450:4727-5662(-)
MLVVMCACSCINVFMCISRRTRKAGHGAHSAHRRGNLRARLSTIGLVLHADRQILDNLEELLVLSCKLVDFVVELLQCGVLLLLEGLQHNGRVARQKGHVKGLHLLRHVLLPAIVISWFLVLDVNHHRKVLPHVVVLVYVPCEAPGAVAHDAMDHRLGVEREAVDPTDEAFVQDLVLLHGLLSSQLSEGVDNDTEDHVELDCDDNDEKGELEAPLIDVRHTGAAARRDNGVHEDLHVVVGKRVDETHEAGHQRAAELILLPDVALERVVAPDSVEVDNNTAKEGDNQQLVTILRHCAQGLLQRSVAVQDLQ